MVTVIPPALKWLIVVQTAILVMLLSLFLLFSFFGSPWQKTITTYEECVADRGSVIQESYPATCITKDKQRFVQPI